MNSNKALLKKIKLGNIELKNKVIMSSLTRCRADYKTKAPNRLHVQYYSERAESAGMILTESSLIEPRSDGFPGACGIYTLEQVEGWKRVTEAVHKVNGRIFLQIWHSGRAAFNKDINGFPIAPSAIRNRHPVNFPNFSLEYDIPKEMTKDDINEVLEFFQKGAENAKEAGFDGLELHGANGYLIDQFLQDATNKREDEYGGSIENRCRFPLQTMDILCNVFGSDKVGIRLSPVGRFNDMFDSNPEELSKYLLKELNKRKIAFVEAARPIKDLSIPNLYGVDEIKQMPNLLKTFRENFKGLLIGNNNFSFEEANNYIEEEIVDMVSFGRLFIANPDLVERFINNWEFNALDTKTYYEGGYKGYNDYPKHKKLIM